jgi:hypothetical protein
MKRLAMGLILTSLLVAAAFSAGAVTIYEDPNALYSASVDGLTGYLLLVNTSETVVYTKVVLSAYAPLNVVVESSYMIVDGSQVDGITAMAQFNYTYTTITLPVALGYMDFVILQLGSRDTRALSLYEAKLY